MKASVYDKKGAEIEKVDLPKEIFEVPFNSDLVEQVYVSMTSNARANTAHAKDRSEVRGGGKKPWKQKGTGRARHGSRRSPIWRKGGITHGPRNERNYDKKINKKVKALALSNVLSQKLRDNELILIDSVDIKEGKTKNAAEIVKNLSKNFANLAKKTAVFSLVKRNENTEKAFRNIKSMRLDLVQNMNIVDILNNKYLIIENPKESFEILMARIDQK